MEVSSGTLSGTKVPPRARTPGARPLSSKRGDMTSLTPTRCKPAFDVFHDHCANGPSWLAGILREYDPDKLKPGALAAIRDAIAGYCKDAQESDTLAPLTAMLQEALLQQMEDWRHSDSRARYREYLESQSWLATRAKVLERAGYVCEGCRERRATEVHHPHYEDPRGEEMLFNLVALCDKCHRKITEREKGRPQG